MPQRQVHHLVRREQRLELHERCLALPTTAASVDEDEQRRAISRDLRRWAIGP